MPRQWMQDNLWKIILAVVTFAAGYAVLTENVRTMKPKVSLNTTHRHVYEEKVSKIEKRQEEYHKENLEKLDEVIDLLEK